MFLSLEFLEELVPEALQSAVRATTVLTTFGCTTGGLHRAALRAKPGRFPRESLAGSVRNLPFMRSTVSLQEGRTPLLAKIRRPVRTSPCRTLKTLDSNCFLRNSSESSEGA